jgi:hypothetical protein
LVLTVALALVAVTAVVLGGFAWLTSRADLERQLAHLRQEQAILADQLAVSLILPVWNFDRAQVERIVEGALANTDVVAVILRFDDASRSPIGRQRGARPAIRAIEDERAIPPGSLRVERAIEGDGERLGRIALFATTDSVRATVRAQFLRALGRIAVLEAVLVASVYGVLWWLLLRPLRILEADAQAVRQGQNISAVVAGRRFRGEIESLRASLLSTLETLQNRYDKLKQAEAALKSLATSFAHLSGKPFFEAVSRQIATVLGVDFVFVGELKADQHSITVLGGYARGEPMGELTYSLNDTPCANVAGESACVYLWDPNSSPQGSASRADGDRGLRGRPHLRQTAPAAWHHGRAPFQATGRLAAYPGPFQPVPRAGGRGNATGQGRRGIARRAQSRAQLHRHGRGHHGGSRCHGTDHDD